MLRSAKGIERFLFILQVNALFGILIMSDTQLQSKAETFLESRLQVYRLAAIQDGERRFRGGDGRGIVAMLTNGNFVEYVEVAEFAEANVRRGGHLHEHYREQAYVVSGTIHLGAHLVGTDNRLEITLGPGSLIVIEPGVAHGFLSLGGGALVISMGSGADPFVDRCQYSGKLFSSDNEE